MTHPELSSRPEAAFFADGAERPASFLEFRERSKNDAGFSTTRRWSRRFGRNDSEVEASAHRSTSRLWCRFLLAAITLAPLHVPLHATTHIAPAQVVSPQARGEVGPIGAPVTMIAFTDFQCPFSSRLFFTLRALEQKYPQQLHVIVKQTPLDIHPDAPLAHRAAIAAGQQGRFNEMAELLYANQNHIDAAAIEGYAAQLHLNAARFHHDLASPEIARAVAQDMEEGRGFGITVTPTLYVNGRILTGVQTESTLAGIIDKAIADAPAIARSRQPESTESITLDTKLLTEVQTAPAPSQGSAAAPLTIVEFTDFQCPFCRAAVAPMEQLMKQRGQQVRWVFRSFPLDFHQDSELANEAALAAGEQGKFWQMHDLLFNNQAALKPANLRSYAEQLQLNMPQFNAALDTHKFAGAIAADRVLGSRAGVSGTPTFVIDGKLVDGVRSLPELLQIADAHANTPRVNALVSQTASTVAPIPVPAAGRTVSGNADAPLTLTWYSDVTSPLAARQLALVRSLIGRYGSKLRVVYCAFPVATRAGSATGAAALIAASVQGQFWPMFQQLAQRHDTLDQRALLQIAESLHLEKTAFNAAMSEASLQVEADRADATRRGVLGAPVVFANRQRIDGLQREEFYTAVLDKELSAASQERASMRAPSPSVR